MNNKISKEILFFQIFQIEKKKTCKIFFYQISFYLNEFKTLKRVQFLIVMLYQTL
jgi:hypothetical protein